MNRIHSVVEMLVNGEEETRELLKEMKEKGFLNSKVFSNQTLFFPTSKCHKYYETSNIQEEILFPSFQQKIYHLSHQIPTLQETSNWLKEKKSEKHFLVSLLWKRQVEGGKEEEQIQVERICIPLKSSFPPHPSTTPPPLTLQPVPPSSEDFRTSRSYHEALHKYNLVKDTALKLPHFSSSLFQLFFFTLISSLPLLLFHFFSFTSSLSLLFHFFSFNFIPKKKRLVGVISELSMTSNKEVLLRLKQDS